MIHVKRIVAALIRLTVHIIKVVLIGYAWLGKVRCDHGHRRITRSEHLIMAKLLARRDIAKHSSIVHRTYN